MRFEFRLFFRGGAAIALLASLPLHAASVRLGELTPIYQGVSFQTASVGDSSAYVVRIDLAAPGIAFTTTPHSGSLDAVAQTTSQFLVSSGTQVAINASFFAPCCAVGPQPKDLLGLAVSNGTVVSPYKPGENDAALLISATNQATISRISGPQPNAFNAVSGSSILVQGGLNIAPTSDTSFNGPNPRTDVGISKDGQYLYFVAIDGRQPGYSVGATLQEAGDLLIGLGAFTGLNLDGGGSTALAQSDGFGSALLLNLPSGGTERFNGNNIGVYAAVLAVPEPGSLWLILLGLTGLIVVARRRSGSIAASRAASLGSM